jgi:hypothetical protein
MNIATNRAPTGHLTAHFLAVLLVLSVTVGPAEEDGAPTPWSGTRRWIGPEWHAGPLQDWQVLGGRLQATPRGGARRFAHLVTRVLERPADGFRLAATVSTVGQSGPENEPAAGLALGTKGTPAHLLHAAVYPDTFYPAALTQGGYLRLGDQTLPLALSSGTPVRLVLTGERADAGRVRLILVAASPQGRELGRLQSVEPENRLRGVVGLFAWKHIKNAPATPDPEVFATFDDFALDGAAIENHPENAFGPVLWTQYTCANGLLRLQAQFPPLEADDMQNAVLELRQADGAWLKKADAPIEPASSTALFEVTDWNARGAVPYRVAYTWNGRMHYWEGLIRSEPDPNTPWKLGLFSCDVGTLFPLAELIRAVREQDPDMLFFAGDQFYEHFGGFGYTRYPREVARLDYLRKWYLFGWTNRHLLKDRPAVIIPDDHDVFQGNIWGQGGRAIPGQPEPPPNQVDTAKGGYAMAPDWVRLVERSQTGHLPPPADPRPVDRGIGVYFTAFPYGGVSFAVLEDRKFKVGPASEEARAGDTTLLGDRQIEFLDRWALDWRGGATMKVILSQTIFAQPVTHAGEKLTRHKQIKDNNAWPIAGRNRALAAIRRSGAFSLHGDQHLALQMRHGLEEWEDAGVAFMGPATVAGYPRAWWPAGEPSAQPAGDKLLGHHSDDFGNKMTIDAVANPTDPSGWPKDPIGVAMAKGSGYAIIAFDPPRQTMTTHCFPLPYPIDPARVENGQYKGWPLKFSAAQNDGRKPVGFLPELTFDTDDPVVGIFDLEAGELLYARRIRGRTFAPPVFAPGRYEVRSGTASPERSEGVFLFPATP